MLPWDSLVSISVPVSAVIVAGMTTVFNVLDRRRFYRIEQQRLDSQRSRSFAEYTDYISNRYNFTTEILDRLSSIKRRCTETEGFIAEYGAAAVNDRLDLISKINEEISGVVEAAVSSQLLLSEQAHRQITQTLVASFSSIFANVRSGAPDTDSLALLRRFRVEIDELKAIIRNDFRILVGEPDSSGVRSV